MISLKERFVLIIFFFVNPAYCARFSASGPVRSIQQMLTERGNFFGYQDLVVDYRNIYDMKQCDVPVVMDVTHSLQQPNQTSGVTGGKPELISLISKAAIAVGADGLFMETHPNPAEAKSDGANMLRLDLVEPLLEQLVKIKEVVK